MTNVTRLWRYPIGVPRAEQPRAEGRFHLPGGRRLGFAEYGDPAGPVVFWFHGTPGGRRQLPLVGRRAAEELGLRVVLVERPGSGLSDPHAYEAVVDWATDIGHLADLLGAERFGVVGLSGGGPYALSCASVPTVADRVAAVALLGSVVPAVGPGSTRGGTINLARRFAPVLSGLRRPLAAGLSGLLLPVIPLGHYLYEAVSRLMPEGDQRVFADPGIKAMFLDDLALAARGRFQALIDDARLFGRDWGFQLADVTAPVRWWHGDSDPMVSHEDARAVVAELPDAELILRPGESHLGGFATADEILGFIHSILTDGPTIRAQ